MSDPASNGDPVSGVRPEPLLTDVPGWGGPAQVHGVPVFATRRRPWWRPNRRELRAATVVVGCLAVVGVGLGLLWYLVAPRPQVQFVAPGQWLRVGDGYSERSFAADGWFFVLTVAAGVVAGVACWLWRSVRGPLMVVALAVGGMLGALLAWQLGQQLAPAPTDGAVGAVVTGPLELSATAALVVEPFAAIVIYVVATGFASRDDLGRGER